MVRRLKNDEARGGGPGSRNETTRRNTTASVPLWAVIAVKSTGSTVVFNTFNDRLEAERVAQQLLAVRCYARVERARRNDTPGRQRRAS